MDRTSDRSRQELRNLRLHNAAPCSRDSLPIAGRTYWVVVHNVDREYGGDED